MAKIIVHLGLPKTATTTLQSDFFSQLDNFINYLGVRHPRNVDQHPLYNEMYKYIEGQVEDELIHSLLGKELDMGKDILISDEMFVVSTSNASWRKKLLRLHNILSGYDYRLLITVREPAQALASYYIELYEKKFSRINISFLEVALTNESMEIFHYDKFFKYLLSYFEKKNIFVKKFEEIISDKLEDLIEFLNVDPDVLGVISLNDRNKRKSSSDYIIVNQKLSVYSILRNIRYRFGFGEKMKSSKIRYLIKPIEPIFNAPIARNQFKFKKPNEKIMKDLRERLYSETLFLRENFNIIYE